MGRPLLLALAAFLVAAPAFAWNGAGHRLVTAIAWDHLDSPTRQAAVDLLRHHPDQERWLDKSSHYPSESPDYVLFVEASTWADDIRRDPRFAGDSPGPVLPGFPDMERHGDWHYDNLPLQGKPRRSPDGQLTERIHSLAAQLGNKRMAPEKRAYALAWLLHLVGDIHQPLHVVSRYDQRGRGDDGGNGLAVRDALNSRHPETNLHTYWDELPGPPWLRGKRLRLTAEALEREGTIPARSDDLPERWRDESLRLAREHLYPDSQAEVPTLDSDYRDMAHSIANQRLVDAGMRLADLLRQILGH
jgi:hypothetical protein